MKTDREFLDGIYQKAKNMTQEKPKEKKFISFPVRRFSAAAAAVFLLGTFFYFSAVPQSQTGTAPAPATLSTRRTPQELVSQAQSVLLLRADSQGQLQIAEIWRGSYTEELAAAVSRETKNFSFPSDSDSVIVFVASSPDFYLMDAFFLNNDGLYENWEGQVYPAEKLKELVSLS